MSFLLAATVWFVAPGGTGDGRMAAPFGSVQAALDVVAPGDTIEVAVGAPSVPALFVCIPAVYVPITVRGALGPPTSIRSA